ncbi:MAG: transcription antitermination factor NusB [Niabella sp.]|nr:MAG: transcription antitermination factor NusB [Niabella sp.]
MKTSKDPRHQARRLAFGYIHALENAGIGFEPQDLENIRESAKELLEIKAYQEDLFNQIVNYYVENKAGLMQTITKNSKEWKLEEMYRTDIIILYIAITELQLAKVPMKVAIDEAVELAKEFCDIESGKFINGVLAGVVQEIQSQKPKVDQISPQAETNQKN